MNLASIIEQFRTPFLKKYRSQLLPSHLKALDAITACKKHCGYFTAQCGSCQGYQTHALSCGHRSCPQCQNQCATQWLSRQKQKLIPCEYFMVTITLPEQLRKLAFDNQHIVYTLMFECAKDTLKTLGLDDRHLGGEIGMTAVLHTHTRRLEFHPHLHIIVPGAAITDEGKAFQRQNDQYLIRGDVIAKMFRGKFLYALNEQCFDLPYNLPKDWVVNVKHIGKGFPALQYLSRYLYRGVISQKNITKVTNTHITFRYRDSTTKQIETRTLPGEDFIWKLLTHVLPRRFRRVRDYGFLHHNAKKKLTLIQYLLYVKIKPEPEKPKTVIKCHRCSQACDVVMVNPRPIPINFRFMSRPPNSE